MLLEEFLRKGDDWVMMDGVRQAFGPKKPLQWRAEERTGGLVSEMKNLFEKQNEERAVWDRSTEKTQQRAAPSIQPSETVSPKKEMVGQKKHQTRSPKKCMSPKKRSSPLKQVLSMSP